MQPEARGEPSCNFILQQGQARLSENRHEAGYQCVKPSSEREKPERPSDERSDCRRPCACDRCAEGARWSVAGPQRPKGEAVAVTMHAPPSPLVES